MNKDAERALQQVTEQRYYQKYQSQGKRITCVGVNFNTATRHVNEWTTLEVE